MALNSASKVIDWFPFKEKGKPAFLKEFKSVLFTLSTAKDHYNKVLIHHRPFLL